MVQENVSEEIVDIGKLSNNELKNKILKINDYQLDKIASMSYYYFISKSTEVLNFIEENSCRKEIKGLREMEVLTQAFDLLLDSFRSLVTEESYQVVEEDKESLFKTRKELFTILNDNSSFMRSNLSSNFVLTNLEVKILFVTEERFSICK